MTIAAESRLGPYEILSPLGAGGMGEVYRARDTKLDRDVAIKVLPESVSRDPDVLSRFEREAKAVAALSHPNILGIFDFGTHDGTAYAVMELLEGETLRSKLDAGVLSQRRAIEYALQIIRGLAAAHEKGIVHRDLKPDNVFVTQDGRVKILDFGLAKTAAGKPGPGGDTRSPTAFAYTEPGAVMGTVGYMSPEQVKGMPVDHRSDIFSFGAVLYEMLSGKRAFQRDTAAETMTAVLREEPPELSAIALSVSPALDRIVRHCLEKNPEQRFRSTDDIAFSLQSLSETSGMAPSAPPGVTSRPMSRGTLWGIAGLLAGAIAGSLLTIALRSTHVSPRRPVRFEVASPQDQQVVGTVALAPDGSRLAFTAREAGGNSTQLWIRAIDDSKARLLRGTEGAQLPFWAPDGESVGFFANGQLKRISISGGPPQPLAPVTSDVRGASWSGDGRIVFAPTFVGPILQVSASGERLRRPRCWTKGGRRALIDGRGFFRTGGTSSITPPDQLDRSPARSAWEIWVRATSSTSDSRARSPFTRPPVISCSFGAAPWSLSLSTPAGWRFAGKRCLLAWNCPRTLQRAVCGLSPPLSTEPSAGIAWRARRASRCGSIARVTRSASSRRPEPGISLASPRMGSGWRSRGRLPIPPSRTSG
jgi:serine/threonine protein kinase